MFEVSTEAVRELTAFFEGKGLATVRVYLASGGCSGPRLTMALDETRDSDELFEEKGFKFCMEKGLYEKTGGVRVDAGYMGFVVESVNPLSSGRSCGSCCSGCGAD
jgi:Fe-S cluster assembly iron-binding protein IscA